MIFDEAGANRSNNRVSMDWAKRTNTWFKPNKADNSRISQGSIKISPNLLSLPRFYTQCEPSDGHVSRLEKKKTDLRNQSFHDFHQIGCIFSIFYQRSIPSWWFHVVSTPQPPLKQATSYTGHLYLKICEWYAGYCSFRQFVATKTPWEASSSIERQPEMWMTAKQKNYASMTSRAMAHIFFGV